MKRSVYDFQSEVCKTFSNPKRLEILNLVKKDELSVSQIIDAMGISKPNVSQHLAVMRLRGLLKARRVGTTIYYRIANERLAYACSLMQDVLSQIMENERDDYEERASARKEYMLQA